MPRAVKDLSEYTFLGKYSWKEAIREGKSVGVMAVKLIPEMLLPEGVERNISNATTQTYMTVAYDKDFLHEYWHRKLILDVGFMRHDILNEAGLRRFFEDQIQYSLAESQRNAESEMLRHAAELSATYGNTQEYWLESLKQGAAKKAEQENSTVDASNGRVKVKA